MGFFRKEMWGIPVWVYLAAFLPRLLVLVVFGGNSPYCVTSDSVGYLKLAAELSSTGFFGLPGPGGQLVPEIFRTPVYPVFLAVLGRLPGGAVLNAEIAQTLIGGLTVLLAWKWFCRLAGKRGAAWGTLFFSLDYVYVMHTQLLLPETLLMFLLLGAAAATWSALEESSTANVSAAGSLWALASFVKPVALYLPILLAPLFWKRKKHAFLFLLLSFSIPLGWSLRNYARTGYFSYSSIGGVVLLKYSAGSVEALLTGKSFTETSSALLAAADGNYPNDAARAAAYWKMAMPIIEAHPFLTARYLLHDFAATAGGTGIEMIPQALGLKEPAAHGGFGSGTLALLKAYPLLWVLEAGYLAFLAGLYFLFAVGLKRLWEEGGRLQAAFLFLSVFYLFGIASTNGYYRYRIPPLLFMAAGAAFGLKDERREFSGRRL